MTIEKNGVIYTVKESSKKWTLERKVDKITIAFEIYKRQCPTFEHLKAYVFSNIVF